MIEEMVSEGVLKKVTYDTYARRSNKKEVYNAERKNFSVV
jgi:hypothetical protein